MESTGCGGIFDLSGRVAVVTGGGSGLGRTISEVLAAYGANVVVVGRSAEKLEETLSRLGGTGAEQGPTGGVVGGERTAVGDPGCSGAGPAGRSLDDGNRSELRALDRHLAVTADLTKPDDIDNMVGRIVDRFGRIDIFFANAGIREKSFVLIHEKPIQDWDDVLDADLKAVFLQMRAVFPIMMTQESGSFVTVSSVGGMAPLANDPWVYTQTAYAVAKAGLIMLTKIAARQYGPYGIRVNCIAPGYHRTPLTPEHEVAEVEATLSKLLPLGRTGMPEEIRGLALWLASNASSFVTGQVLVEDGGYLA